MSRLRRLLARVGVVVDDVDVFVLEGEVRDRVRAGELLLRPPLLIVRRPPSSPAPEPRWPLAGPGGVQ